MRRISDPTAVPDLFGAGKPGFTDGDPIASIPTTNLNAEWFNGVQEEPLAVVEAAGLVPSGTDRAQLLAALRAMFAPHIQVFAANGTFVVPAGVTRVKARVWGGGGGGGGCSAAGAARGGGGGEYREGVFAVTPGASIAVTVGAGGARGINTPSSGAAGGASSFGALVTAAGGQGGAGSGGGVATTGGTGGTGGSGGQYARPGASSELSYQVGSSYSMSPGGGTYGAGYGAFIIASNGNDGWAAGCGGSGGANGAGLGGNGTAGLIIVEW